MQENTQKNILMILSSDAENYKEKLDSYEIVKDLIIYVCSSVEEAQPYLQDVTVLLADPGLAKEIVNEMPKLLWLQSTWAGVNSLVAEDLRQDYLLTGVKGIFGALMSEYVFGYILQLERNVKFHQHAQSQRSWQPKLPARLKDKTIGIMGTGSIGQHVAATAQHFAMTVLGFSHSGKAKPNFDSCFAHNDFHAFLADCDYVVSTLPDTPETAGLLNQLAFEAMKPTAWLINVGRGVVVDEVALLASIRSRDIAGAVLDVFVEEPLPKEHPFWSEDKIVITPHISAPSFPEDVVDIFMSNYQRFVKGQDLEFQIDFAKGY